MRRLDSSAGTDEDPDAELREREPRRGGEVHTDMEHVPGQHEEQLQAGARMAVHRQHDTQREPVQEGREVPLSLRSPEFR